MTIQPCECDVEALVRTQRSAPARMEKTLPRVIGVQARPDWQEATSFDCRRGPVRVAPCRSALEVRAELVESDDPAAWLVVLTDREQRELGLDVLARLARRRLHSIDLGQPSQRRFGRAPSTPHFGGSPISPTLFSSTARRAGSTRRRHRARSRYRHGLPLPSASWGSRSLRDPASLCWSGSRLGTLQ